MIKLEVNHGKHKKKENGQKLTLPEEPEKPKEEKKVEKSEKKSKKQKETKEDKKEKQDKKGKKDKKDKNKQKQDEKEKIKGKSEEKKKDSQLETIQRIKAEGEKTKLTIEELINQYKNVAEDIFVNHGHNPEKQMLINKKLQALQKQKQQRHARIGKIDQKIEARRERFFDRVSQKEEKLSERKKEKRRKKAEKKLEMLKALSQQRLEKQAAYQQYLHNQFKKKVPRFKKYEEQFTEKQKSFEEQIKEKLEKNKRKYAPMNVEQLEEFQDNYESHKYDLIEENEKKRDEIMERIQEENANLKAKLWKGQCHKNIKRELEGLIEKKNEAKTKLQKTKNYGTIVKSSFKPKLDESKRSHSLAIGKTIDLSKLSIEEDNEEEMKFKKVAREKYLKGVNKGLMIQKMRKSLDHQEKVRKGNSYLEQIKNLPKIRKDGVQSAKLEQTIEQEVMERVRKSPDTTFKQKRIRNPYYRSSLSEKLPSKGEEKKIKDPQIVNYLLSDIKGKHREMDLEQKVIKHGRYNGVLELQDRHNNLNKKMVQSINEKLQILSRM